MMKFRFLFYLLAATLLTGCGQTVVETLQVPTPVANNGRSVVLLPFADYTSSDNIAGAYRRNLTVTEAMTDRLVANGFSLAVQEDVFGYLVDEQIINVANYEGNGAESLVREMDNEWSPSMKHILKGYIDAQKRQMDKTISKSPGTHALDQKAVAKIGRQFNADYVVRGRILEYTTRDEATWIPWKKGILPFFHGSANRILNGFAGSDFYDERNAAVTGILTGSVLGYNNADAPFDDKTILGMVNGSVDTIFWGGVGAAAGNIAHTSGKNNQAVVQMRVWVQEATTGNVVWTNRVRVLVSAESVFADNQLDTLFNKAIEKGVATLVDNFVTYGL